jgi:hypothetical protein
MQKTILGFSGLNGSRQQSDTFPKGRLNAGYGIQRVILKHNSRMRARHL